MAPRKAEMRPDDACQHAGRKLNLTVRLLEAGWVAAGRREGRAPQGGADGTASRL